MQTFSRDYLRGLPEATKNLYMNDILRKYVPDIQYTAQKGKYSHLVNINLKQINNPPFPSIPPPLILTMNDLMNAFQNMFPDCKITQEEGWIETKPGVKELKSGIRVDWS